MTFLVSTVPTAITIYHENVAQGNKTLHGFCPPAAREPGLPKQLPGSYLDALNQSFGNAVGMRTILCAISVIPAENFGCFHFTGNEGLYIHPNVWHDGAMTALGQHCFFDKQGAVHARVSVDFPREFNCLLEVPLEKFNKS